MGQEIDPIQELECQRAENARLIALLESHGIEWRMPTPAGNLPSPASASEEPSEPSRLSTHEKVDLFRRLFRGRADIYPVRWESETSGKSGYAPACANEWRPGVCEKPRIKCGDCAHRRLKPVTDAVIYDHLAGKRTVGVYPLLTELGATIETSRTGSRVGVVLFGEVRVLHRPHPSPNMDKGAVAAVRDWLEQHGVKT